MVPWAPSDWLLSSAHWSFYVAVGLYAVSLVLSEQEFVLETANIDTTKALDSQFALLWTCIPITALGMFLLLFHSISLPKGMLFTHHLRIVAVMASHAGQTLIVGARLAKVHDIKDGNEEDHSASRWMYTGAGMLYGVALMLAVGSALYSAFKETSKAALPVA